MYLFHIQDSYAEDEEFRKESKKIQNKSKVIEFRNLHEMKINRFSFQ